MLIVISNFFDDRGMVFLDLRLMGGNIVLIFKVLLVDEIRRRFFV